MTKSRKISLIVALTFVFVLSFATFFPLLGANFNVAHAVTVESRDEWTNSYEGDYYDNLNLGLRGTDFRSELADLITRTHTRLTTYNSGTYALQNVWPQTDIDPKTGQMIWFYTGTTTSPSNFGGSNGTTNREHVWAKRGDSNGAFNSDAKVNVGADAHHLRPTETQLNSERGDNWFDELTPGASGVSIARQNGQTNYGSSPDELCYKNSNYFYPAKGYRGATARILFYVETRWGDKYGLGFSDTLQHTNVKLIGIISTLLKWHLEEPPTDEEIFRNNEVAKIQGNRNPFIDHPEFAEMIYCHDGKSYNNKLQSVVAQYGGYLDNSNPGVDPDPTLTSISLSVSELNLTVGHSSSQITVTATPSNASKSVTWSTSDDSVATVANGIVTAVGVGTATITATSTVDTSISASLQVNVTKVQLQQIVISPATVQLSTGGSQQLTATPTPSNADGRVTWSSSDTGVATVTQQGMVSAVATGTATITATSVDNPNVVASITVTVITQEQNAQEFVDSLAAIESATTMDARYNAIKRAIDAYNQMSDTEKFANAAGYSKLQAAINAYNNDVELVNDEFEQATNVAAQLMVNGVSVSFMAIVAIVIKRLLRV